MVEEPEVERGSAPKRRERNWLKLPGGQTLRLTPQTLECGI